jgi:ATP-dependent Clp protease ATP-binding subunit ClpC
VRPRGEHILLGLAEVNEGVGAQAVWSAGIGLEAIRHHAEELTGRARQPSEHVSFGGSATRVFRFAEREAGQLGDDYVGTGHVPLGLIQDRERVAAQVLARLQPDLEGLRRLVADRVTASPTARPPSESCHLASEQPVALRPGCHSCDG